MLQQVSDFELELMKTIWENGGTALYAEIVEGLEKRICQQQKTQLYLCFCV
mgnify:CR=1 FL=1